MDLSNLDYFSAAIAVIMLAMVWGVVQRMLKFTMRIFACGCAVIAGLALGIFVLVNWEEIVRALGL